MTEPEFQMVRTDDGHRVRLVAANGLTLAVSSEAYARRRDARNMLEILASVFGFRTVEWGEAAVGAEPGHYVQLVDEGGETRHLFVRLLDARPEVSS